MFNRICKHCRINFKHKKKGKQLCNKCFKISRKKSNDKWKSNLSEEQLIKQKLYFKEYSIKNKDKIYQANKLWHLNNIEKSRKYHRNKDKQRCKIDPNFKLSGNLRKRICSAIKRQSGKKAYKTIELLGCSVQECRDYLESKFKSGMTWENHGQINNTRMEGWEIDHIRPVSSFDLTDPEQQKLCFHFSNLQPLWAEENLKKGIK